MKYLLNESVNIDTNDLRKFYNTVRDSKCFGLDTISSTLGFGWESSLKFLAQLEFIGAIERYGDKEFQFVEVFENYTNRIFVVREDELARNSKDWSIVDGPVSRFEYCFKSGFITQMENQQK